MNGMSKKITWTRTVPVPFNAGVMANQARNGAFMAMGSMPVCAAGPGDRRHADRPDRRRGCGMVAVGVGRHSLAGHRAASAGRVHAVELPDVRTARRRHGGTSRCCSWRRSDRIPLGTASALEFLGPLGVAVAHGKGRNRIIWPGLAAARCRAAHRTVGRRGGPRRRRRELREFHGMPIGRKWWTSAPRPRRRRPRRACRARGGPASRGPGSAISRPPSPTAATVSRGPRDRGADRRAEPEPDALEGLGEHEALRVRDWQAHRRVAHERAGVDDDRALLRED